MSETLQIELTRDERELLLRGLRYVRSSIMLADREPTLENQQQRREEVRQVEELVDHLNGATSAAAV